MTVLEHDEKYTKLLIDMTRKNFSMYLAQQ